MGLGHILESAVTHFVPDSRQMGKAAAYKAMYINSRHLTLEGVAVRYNNSRRPLLMLGGTSISLEDQKELIVYLLKAGLEVAAVQTPMGGPLDFDFHPVAMRQLSLEDFVGRLKNDESVKGIDIIAHSYAAYEVVRILTASPPAYRQTVKSVLLINPPGFQHRTGFFPHCLGSLWYHVIGGYVRCWQCRIGLKRCLYDASGASGADFIDREIAGINSMTFKALNNPVRTIQEIRDIVSFRLLRPIYLLQTLYGYDFNFFLNTGDRIVPVSTTLKSIAGVIPARNIKVVPGGHNDLLFQKWQRPALLSFIEAIRMKNP